MYRYACCVCRLEYGPQVGKAVLDAAFPEWCQLLVSDRYRNRALRREITSRIHDSQSQNVITVNKRIRVQHSQQPITDRVLAINDERILIALVINVRVLQLVVAEHFVRRIAVDFHCARDSITGFRRIDDGSRIGAIRIHSLGSRLFFIRCGLFTFSSHIAFSGSFFALSSFLRIGRSSSYRNWRRRYFLGWFFNNFFRSSLFTRGFLSGFFFSGIVGGRLFSIGIVGRFLFSRFVSGRFGRFLYCGLFNRFLRSSLFTRGFLSGFFFDGRILNRSYSLDLRLHGHFSRQNVTH